MELMRYCIGLRYSRVVKLLGQNTRGCVLHLKHHTHWARGPQGKRLMKSSKGVLSNEQCMLFRKECVSVTVVSTN